MAYRPNSAGATRRASTATPSRFAASMTGRPIMVHRSPLMIADRLSPGDALSSVGSEPASASALPLDAVGSVAGGLDAAVLSGRYIVVPRRRDQWAASPAPLCGARRATAVEDLAGRSLSLEAETTTAARQLSGVGGGTMTEAGSARVVPGRRRADCGRSAAAAFAGGGVPTGGCAATAGDG